MAGSSCCIVATSGWASSEAFLVQGSGVLGSAMAASPPGLGRFRAATCRRWGDVGALVSVARKEARRHYFMRVARRAMRTRKPALASRSRSASAAQVAVPAAMAAPRWAPPALTRASLPSQARPRMTIKKRKRKMPACVLPRSSSEHMLAVCPSMIARAEAKAAPRSSLTSRTAARCRSRSSSRASIGRLLIGPDRRRYGPARWTSRTLTVSAIVRRVRGLLWFVLSRSSTSRNSSLRLRAPIR